MSDEDWRVLIRKEPGSYRAIRLKFRSGVELTNFEKIKLLLGGLSENLLDSSEIKKLYWALLEKDLFVEGSGLGSQLVLAEVKRRHLNVLRPEETAEFSWDFGRTFWLETRHGNYLWDDPDHDGDNTIIPYNFPLQTFLNWSVTKLLRGKGRHQIGAYCGPKVQFLDAMVCRVCGNPLDPEDNILGRWCDPTCADKVR